MVGVDSKQFDPMLEFTTIVPTCFTERSLVHVHSGSLDSISTSVSLATTQTHPTRSSSLDNLHQPRGEGGERGGGGGGSDPQCNTKRDSGKKYMLLETSSVVSGVCADEEKEERKAMMTRSLPVEVERHIAPHSNVERRTEIDGFSDNFVGGSAGEEGRLGTSQVVRSRNKFLHIPSIHFGLYVGNWMANCLKRTSSMARSAYFKL